MRLKNARDQGIVWDDVDLEIVSWSIMVLSDKIPEKMTECDCQVDYSELAKVICRLVFPPDVLQKLKLNEE